jgi:hypothetical protein
MHVTVEDVSGVKKTLHIEIPQEEVVRELDSAYGQLKKTAKIKGFRPGPNLSWQAHNQEKKMNIACSSTDSLPLLETASAKMPSARGILSFSPFHGGNDRQLRRPSSRLLHLCF